MELLHLSLLRPQEEEGDLCGGQGGGQARGGGSKEDKNQPFFLSMHRECKAPCNAVKVLVTIKLMGQEAGALIKDQSLAPA